VTRSSSDPGDAGVAAGATWCVLVAAGAGKRFGSEHPKAFVGLAGRPLLAESLERLDASEWVDAIVVAAPPGWEEPTILLAEELVASKVAAVVTGGATRAESVRVALAEVPDDVVVVLVHDAARPLVDDAVIERLLGRLAEGVDGVVPGIRIGDTVKRVDRGIVAETIDREALVAVQTPQAFVSHRLRAAYDGELTGATDCASLVERAGGRVAVVPGDRRLVKVTSADDLELVARLVADDGR
jgi:2-C-methyl-D-erythritol 4-phosphate cytidylyltransferase